MGSLANISLLPTITGRSTTPIRILLINPNSTSSMTDACLSALVDTLPPTVTVTGFTAPRPGPSAIEGYSDSIFSSAEVIRAVLPIAPHYDAFLIACFSAHPVIAALREEVEGPVIGIMEAALYGARMLGARLGVVSLGVKSKIMHEDAIRSYGLEAYSVGCETVGLGVLDLERKNRAEVLERVGKAAERLVVERGADCVLLGCAGMVDMKRKCEEMIGTKEGHAMVVDGVGMGVQILVGLVSEGQKTPKGGAFKSSAETRATRGQDWF